MFWRRRRFFQVGGWGGKGMVGWLGASALLLLAVIDDVVRPLRPREKMLLLLLAIAAWLGCGPRLEWLALPGMGRVELGWWGWPLTIMWFVLLCNAFNFMDGIDGLSALQTICACFWAGLLLWELGSWVAPVVWVLAAAAGGFLVFNFPPARIFMGDVGALFIGFSIAACGILGARAGLPLWVFGALMAVYLFDVGYTLIRRSLRGENVLQAHRKHLYQRLDKLGWSHWSINAVAICITTLMGLGAYWHMDEGSGLGYFIPGGIALLVGAVWIEARDLEFG